MVWNTYASRSAYFLRLLVEASKQSSQHGVYEKAQGVQNYAAFAPPANGGHD